MSPRLLPIGKAIRASRESQGLSRAAVADLCRRKGRSVHPNAIFRLELARGDTRMETIQAVCSALGMKIDLTPKRLK